MLPLKKSSVIMCENTSHKVVLLSYLLTWWPSAETVAWLWLWLLWKPHHFLTNLGCNLYFNQTFIMVSMEQNFGSILQFCSSLRPNIFLTPRFQITNVGSVRWNQTFQFKLDTLAFSFFNGGCLIDVHLYNKLGLRLMVGKGWVCKPAWSGHRIFRGYGQDH